MPHLKSRGEIRVQELMQWRRYLILLSIEFHFQYFMLGKGLFPTAATFGCCNIGTKLSKVTNGYDCLIIPGEKINRRATQKL